MNFFSERKRRNVDKVALGSAVVSCLVMQVAATVAPAQSPVPIEKEPQHHLKLENKFVRVFDVLIPPGEKSLFHTHVHDGLSVRLTDARIRDEPVGGASEDLTVKRGAVSFGYRPRPMTHRVSNIGQTPFRNLFVEVLPSAGVSANSSPPVKATGYEVILENECVRILRLVLPPGRAIDARRHACPTLRIAVSEGEVVAEPPTEKRKAVKIEPGDIEWQKAGSHPSLRNVGSVPFEAVVVELK